VQGLVAALIRLLAEDDPKACSLMLAYGVLSHLLLNFVHLDYFAREQAVVAAQVLIQNQPSHVNLLEALGGVAAVVAVLTDLCCSTQLSHLCALLMLKAIIKNDPSNTPRLSANVSLQHALVRLFYSSDKRIQVQSRVLLQTLYPVAATYHVVTRAVGIAAFDALPMGQYTSPDCCSVCLETFTAAACVWLPCFHVFHVVCVREWLVDMGKDSCPVCKLAVVRTVGMSMLTRTAFANEY
jgi:hypothetical protein